MDSLKLTVAVAILLAAIGGFYYYGDQSLLIRVLALLAAATVSAVVALQTGVGRNAWGFIGETRTEVRKVVWPSRQETIQTTLVVIVMVILVGVMLGLFDMFLGWAVQKLTGQGG